MVNTLLALLISAMIIALVNIFYRASFHMAGFTILVYMSVVIWGQLLLILAVLIPLIGWAKYKINDHSPLQMALGIVLAIVVASMTLYWLV